jgi:hypothetical protein
VSSLVKTTTGDNTNVSGAPGYNAVYTEANGTLQLVFNTNCACCCVCCCAPGGCFLGSEYVLMSDGTEKRLDQVRPGEWVACHFSGKAPVFAVRETNPHENKMYRINNDIITTGEHAFWSPVNREWLVCDKQFDHRQSSPKRRVKAKDSGQTTCMYFPQGLNAKQMQIGDRLLVGDRLVTVFKIDPVIMPSDSPKLITLVTTTSMIIRGGWVVSGWSGKDFDKPIHNDINRRLKMLRGEISQWTSYSQ